MGRLVGTVREASTGQPLPGATVVIEGTTLGTSTSTDGAFAINVPAGSHTVRAQFVGFRSATRSVDIREGMEAAVSFALREAPIQLGGVLATADRPFSAASSRAVRSFDIQVRPVRTTQDLLRLAPGLVIAQHAGGGKAEQIFLRGFDADHGTDVAISVDGIPVNMVSHGHGQGYADLHFVIPQTVESIDVYKGPYFARFGNLATAGAVAFETAERLDEGMARAEVGGFRTIELTGLSPIPLGSDRVSAYAAGQVGRSDGPFESPQGFRRANGFAKITGDITDASTLTFDAAAYDATWSASGQVPQRALASGLISRFGAINDQEGGATSRYHANLRYRHLSPSGARFDAQAFAVRYDFRLFSDFTFFLDNPAAGDMIEQGDARIVSGLNGTYRLPHAVSALGDAVATASMGAGVRLDHATVLLAQSPARVRTTTLADADIAERNAYLWAEDEVVLSRALRVQVGVRADHFHFNVADRLDGLANAPGGLPHASGTAQQFAVSPKASVVLTPTRGLDLFANAGLGFHSNDARNVVLAARIQSLVEQGERDGRSVDEIRATLEERGYDAEQANTPTLPRAVGAELGARIHTFGRRLTVGAAAWRLDLEREFVYVGDAGTTELSGRSQRMGVDLDARAQLLPWLAADTDVSLSRGVFPDEPEGANAIPLAPHLTTTGGITAIRPSGLRGGLRYRAVGDRPANEDGSVRAKGYLMLDAHIEVPIRRVSVRLSLENLTNTEWNEAQFDTESRLRNEPAPVSELHFTPGNPRNVRLGLTYSL